jgi:hypothetical protein
MRPYASVVEQYVEFAAYAASDSPTFEAWSRSVAVDPEVQEWLAGLPPIKQQPNLVFAAARLHGVAAPGPYEGLRDALLGDDGSIRATILSHATQTNEVGRLATLLPAFGRVARDRPLALLEVGASAGLNLYPDRWGYAWRTDEGTVTLGPEPRLECRVKGPAPLPDRLPEIAWRGGIDLHPLAVSSADDMAWLRTLVWPEHDDRRDRLDHAVGVALADPPRLVAGDLLTELPGLVERAASYGDVVVFHSAVIAYLEPEDRLRFADLMTGLVGAGACHWVSNESKNVLPQLTDTGPEIPPEKQTFVLGVDGLAVAHTHGHGRAMRWFADQAVADR